MFVKKKNINWLKGLQNSSQYYYQMFIGLFPVTLGISNVGSYLKTSTVKKYEIIEDKSIGEKLAKDWCLNIPL